LRVGPDLVTQRRNAIFMLWTTMQGWMTGGDLVVVQGGEVGSDFFPGLSGEPGPAWEAVRRIFSLGEGTPRRLPCAVVPATAGPGLGDTHWVAAENGPALVTALLMPGYADRARPVRLLLSVPWTGPTEGAVDGVRGVFDWRGSGPEPWGPNEVTLAAATSERDADGRLWEGARGHVELEVALDEFVRVRLWPAGRAPVDRLKALERMPAERVAGPGVPPPKPPAFWLGMPARRERVELPLDRWALVMAPYEGFWRGARARCTSTSGRPMRRGGWWNWS
jgi:hypothetical protein